MYETEKMVLNISENALLEFEKNFTEVIFLANVGIVNTTAKSQEDTRQSPDALQSDGNAQSSVPMQQVADAINLFVPPVLFAVGLVANVLVIMVMQSKDFRQISTSFYMCISSIVDMVSLGISLPAHFLYVNFPDVSKLLLLNHRYIIFMIVGDLTNSYYFMCNMCFWITSVLC